MLLTADGPSDAQSLVVGILHYSYVLCTRMAGQDRAGSARGVPSCTWLLAQLGADRGGGPLVGQLGGLHGPGWWLMGQPRPAFQNISIDNTGALKVPRR